MNINALWNDNRLHVGFTLSLIWLLNIWHFRFDPNLIRIIVYPLLAILIIAILDFGLTYARYKKLYLPTAAVVSGFLIGLIISPSVPVYVVLVSALFVSLSKQIIAIGARRHIFNPAAFGIMAVSLIFGASVAWWGISWGWYPLLILVPLMVRVLAKLKRLFLPLGFLLVYLIYLAVTSSFESAMKIIIDPTVLLFALVMLPEPITSPASGYFKYGFGAMVAVFSIIISKLTVFPEVFLPALLVANLFGFWLIKIRKTSENSPSAN